MKQMTYADLTPDFLKELSALCTAEEIIEACKAKSMEISEQSAVRLMEQFKKANELSRENVEKIAGGGKGYSGTQVMLRMVTGRAAACGNDCWDWNGNGINDDQEGYPLCDWDLNNNGIDDDIDHSHS